MEQLYLVIDIDRCWGCKSCQTACKCEHSIPAGMESPIEAFRVERLDERGVLQCDFLPVPCQHCNQPTCMEACPAGAIARDEEGLVQINRTLCISCGACEEVCPYGSIFVGETAEGTGAYKCDLCSDRRARGMEPSCVQHCMGRALTVCTQTELSALKEGRYIWSVGRTVYLSDKLSGLYE